MTDAPSAFPLAWPAGFPRTLPGQRKPGRFTVGTTRIAHSGRSYSARADITVAGALKRLQSELDRIGARYAVISSNLELRLDGLPRSGQPEPHDPGIAVYFQLKGKPTTMPCDRYTTVAANIAAVAAHIEAVRAIERHGVGTLEQMFTGFQAIRGPGPKPWREVLGIKPGAQVTRDMLRTRYIELARQHHPDSGGSDAAMAEISAAVDRALAENTE